MHYGHIAALNIVAALLYGAAIVRPQPAAKPAGAKAPPPVTAAEQPAETPEKEPPKDDGGSGGVPVHALSNWPPPFAVRAGTWFVHTPVGAAGSGVAPSSQDYLLCCPRSGEWMLMDADEGLPYGPILARPGLGGLTREEFALLVGGEHRVAEWGAYTRRPW